LIDLVNILIARLTVTNLMDLIKVLDDSPDGLYESLCEAFTKEYPNAAQELFNKEEL